MKIKLFRRVAFGVLALLGAGRAEAAMVEYNFSFSFERLFDGTDSVSFPKSFLAEFDKFDASLGTLTAVKFSYAYEFQLTMVISDTGSSGSASAGGPMMINGADGTGDGFGNGGGGAPGSTVIAPVAIIKSYTVPGDISGFVKTVESPKATFDFQSTVLVSPPQGPGGHATFDILPSSNVKVEYTYTPVPEPSSAGLVLIGCVAFVRRRRSGAAGDRGE
jgi:hypothetical protein